MDGKIFLNILQISSGLTFLLLYFALFYKFSHIKNKVLFIVRICLLVNLCLTVAIIGRLAAGFISDDFSLAYVAGHSSKELAFPYKISAIWSGQEGALLVWMCITSILAFYAVSFITPKLGNVGTFTGLFLSLITVCFSFILSKVTPIFAINSLVPSNGRGLSSALQSPFSFLHPPLIFSSYAALSLAFALAIGLYFCKQERDEGFFLNHLAHVRIWGLLAWFGLTLSILLGGLWAYQEFNGRYWQWDPLENMALATWLLMTSWIHVLAIDRKEGRTSQKSLIFLCLAFIIPLIGSYLVRNGLLQRGLANKGLGYLLGSIAIIIVVAVVRVSLVKSDFDQLLKAAAIFASCAAVLILIGSGLLLPKYIFILALMPLAMGIFLLLLTGFLKKTRLRQNLGAGSLITHVVHLGVILMLSGFWCESLTQKVVSVFAPQIAQDLGFYGTSLFIMAATGGLCILAGMLAKIFDKSLE